MIHSSIVQGKRSEIVCVIKEEIQPGFRLSSLAVACNTKQITKQLSCFQLAVFLYVKSVMIYVVLASPAQLSLLQEGELHARNMPFFFLSDVSCSKNENWVGVWCCDRVLFCFVFNSFFLCVWISQKKRWGFLVGCCYPWWVWTMVCSCQRGQAIPSAYFASLVLSPFIPAMTTENKLTKNKLENGQGELCCSSEEEDGSLQAETDARAGLRLISRIVAFLWQ